MPVRLLLLMLVVTDLLVPAGMSPSSSAAAVATSEHVECPSQASHDGDDEHARGSLVRLCVCCSAETETAAPCSETTLRLPSEPHDVAAVSAPITEEHARLPFRPPMSA